MTLRSEKPGKHTNTHLGVTINYRNAQQLMICLNPLIATLKPQSNGPSYSNIVIGTLAVDGWAVTFGTARRRVGLAQVPPCCTKCNSPPFNGQCTVPTSYYSM